MKMCVWAFWGKVLDRFSVRYGMLTGPVTLLATDLPGFPSALYINADTHTHIYIVVYVYDSINCVYIY